MRFTQETQCHPPKPTHTHTRICRFHEMEMKGWKEKKVTNTRCSSCWLRSLEMGEAGFSASHCTCSLGFIRTGESVPILARICEHARRVHRYFVVKRFFFIFPFFRSIVYRLLFFFFFFKDGKLGRPWRPLGQLVGRAPATAV